MNFEVIEQEVENAKIKVVGVGGGGGNAVIHMINHKIAGVDLSNILTTSPGQACVFYSQNNLGDKGLGGGWIDRTVNNYLST